MHRGYIGLWFHKPSGFWGKMFEKVDVRRMSENVQWTLKLYYKLTFKPLDQVSYTRNFGTKIS